MTIQSVACGLFVLALALPLSADDRQQFILLPLLTSEEVPGAGGSRWKVVTAAHNGNSTFVSFGPCNVPTDPPCPPASFGIAAGQWRINPTFGFTNAGRNGRLIYLHRDLARQVTLTARFFNLQDPSDRGVALPLPRSEEFVRRAIQLLNVPMSDAARVTLRIYDPDDTGASARVTVRIYDVEDRVVSVREVALSPSGYSAPGGLPFAPSFAELLVDVAGTNPEEPVRVEVQPVTAELRIWAFITITDNATNRVTVVWPD